MVSIMNLPTQLIYYLKGHLTLEDIHSIADDYGERTGHEGSLYDLLVERSGVQQVVRVLVLHTVARRDVMGLVHLIVEHYPALQEELYALGFETPALIRSYLTTLQREIGQAEKQEKQTETLRYFSRQTAILNPIQQDQPLDFTLLLQTTSEAAAPIVFTDVNLDELLTTQQYVILSHMESAVGTSVLSSLASHMIEDWLRAPTDAVIPVFVSLEKWFNATLDLQQFLQLHMTWLGVPQFAEVLPDLMHAGKVVLLLEGLESLPFAQYNERMGLLDDMRVLSIAQLSEEHQWRAARCVVSCREKNFLFGPQWYEVYACDPAREQQPQLSDNPVLTLKTHIDSLFEHVSVTDRLPEGITASELQTLLGRLAFNVTSSEHVLRSKRSSSENEPVRVEILTAAAWLFHLQELNNFEMERVLNGSQEELQLAEQLFAWAEVVGILTSESKHWFYSYDEPMIYFSDEYIKDYLCLHYCLAHMQENIQLVGRLLLSHARKVWWLWRAYDPDLLAKLVRLLQSGDEEIRSDVTWILRWCGDSRVVEPLIALCDDSSARVRRNAAFTLSELHDHCAIGPLLRLLQDVHASVRWSAVHALSVFDDERVMSSVIQALDDEDEDVSFKAVLVLEEIGDVRAVPALISALSDKRGTSYAAKDALVKLGKVAVPALIETLTRSADNSAMQYRSFGDDDEHLITYLSIEALGEIGDTRSLPILMWLAEYDRREVRSGKARHAATKAVQEIQKRHRLNAPLLVALRKQEANIHTGAMFALGLLNDNRVVEPLVQALQDENEYMRWGAARLLGNMGDKRAIAPLIGTLRDTQDKVRESASAALHKFGAPIVTLLIPLLEDTDSNMRLMAVRLLSKIQSKEAVEPLIVALSDANYRIREGAVVALGSIGDKRVLEALIAVANDPHIEVRNKVGEAVSKIDPEQAVYVLIAALQDKSDDVRYDAAHDLIQHGSSQAVEALIAALKDPYAIVREYAAYALEKHGDSRAVEPLIELLQKENGAGATAAAGALATLADERAIVPIIEKLAVSEEGYSSSRFAEALLPFGEAIIQPLINALEDKGPDSPIYSLEFWQQSSWNIGREYFRVSQFYYYAINLLGKFRDVRALPVLMWMAAKDYSRPPKRIASIASQEFLKELLGEGTREESSTSADAVWAIQNIIQHNPSRDILAGLLDAQDEATRCGAAFALGRYHDNRAVQGLIEALKQRDRRIRWGAVRLLDGFGGYRKIAPLIALLGDEDKDVISMTASVLARAGKTAIRPLIAALVHEDSRNLSWIAYALIWIGKPAVRPLLMALREKHSDYSWIAHALGKIGKPALRPLIAALRSHDVVTRYYAAIALGKIGDNRAIRPLTALLNGGNIYDRVGAATALAAMSKMGASERLLALLKHKKSVVRAIVIHNLSQIEHVRREVIMPIIEALMDEEKGVRLRAVVALGDMGDYLALEVLQMIVGIRRSFSEATLAEGRYLSELWGRRSARALPSAQEEEDDSDVLLEDFQSAQAIRLTAQQKVNEPKSLLEEDLPTQVASSPTPSLNPDESLLGREFDLHDDESFFVEKAPSTSLPVPKYDASLLKNPWNVDLFSDLDDSSLGEEEVEIAESIPALAELMEAIKQRPEAYLHDKDTQEAAQEAIKQLERRGIRTFLS